MDARRWYLSKLAPKRYGDRIEHAHSITLDVQSMPTQDLERLVAEQAATLQLLPDGTVEGVGVGGNNEDGGV
jgi:hypothetical protein